MFTLADYVGTHADSPDWDERRKMNAEKLIIACSILQKMMELAGVHFTLNPHTGTTISGEIYGGFRPQNCTQGAPLSAHKEGLAVDRYDPSGDIDAWIMDNPQSLVQCGIYIEHPSATIGWSHWSIKSPRSGLHVFYP
jgi:hypothetical protein